MRIGLSLSFCVKDILGKPEDPWPDYIVAQTRLPTVDAIYEAYGCTYWCDYNKHEVMNLLIRLWDRIVQPRLMGGPFIGYSINISRARYIECRTWAEFWVRAENANFKTNSDVPRMFSPAPCNQPEHWQDKELEDID